MPKYESAGDFIKQALTLDPLSLVGKINENQDILQNLNHLIELSDYPKPPEIRTTLQIKLFTYLSHTDQFYLARLVHKDLFPDGKANYENTLVEMEFNISQGYLWMNLCNDTPYMTQYPYKYAQESFSEAVSQTTECALSHTLKLYAMTYLLELYVNRLHKLKKAGPLAQTLIDFMSNHPPQEQAYLLHAYYILACYYAENKDFEKALEWINKADPLSPAPLTQWYFKETRPKIQLLRENVSGKLIALDRADVLLSHQTPITYRMDTLSLDSSAVPLSSLTPDGVIKKPIHHP